MHACMPACLHACRMKTTTSGRLDGRRRRMQVRWMHGSSNNGIGREAEVFRGCCREVVDGHMDVRQGRTSQMSSVPEGG